MELIFEKYILLWAIVLLLVLSFIFTIILYLLRPPQDRGDLPIAVVFEKVISDVPSLLAFLLTSLVILLIAIDRAVPTIIQDGFFLAVGYYFGERKKTAT